MLLAPNLLFFQIHIYLICQELIGNYIYMEEYFMRETVMKVNFFLSLNFAKHIIT